jgi:hypothetical protein
MTQKPQTGAKPKRRVRKSKRRVRKSTVVLDAEPEVEDESLLHELPTPDPSTLPVITEEARKAGWHKAIMRIQAERARLTGRPNSMLISGQKARPIDDGVREAMVTLWSPSGVPPRGLKAKNRDNQILGWLKRNKRSVPEGNHGLAKAVQRVMKSLKPPV